VLACGPANRAKRHEPHFEQTLAIDVAVEDMRRDQQRALHAGAPDKATLADANHLFGDEWPPPVGKIGPNLAALAQTYRVWDPIVTNRCTKDWIMAGTGDVDAPATLGCSRRAISASVPLRKADVVIRCASRPPAPTSDKSFRLELIRPSSLQVSLNERAV
jgi:hypothetical protein